MQPQHEFVVGVVYFLERCVRPSTIAPEHACYCHSTAPAALARGAHEADTSTRMLSVLLTNEADT